MIDTHPPEYEAYLFHEGSLFESYKVLGAHSEINEGEKGTRSTVWAPALPVYMLLGISINGMVVIMK